MNTLAFDSFELILLFIFHRHASYFTIHISHNTTETSVDKKEIPSSNEVLIATTPDCNDDRNERLAGFTSCFEAPNGAYSTAHSTAQRNQLSMLNFPRSYMDSKSLEPSQNASTPFYRSRLTGISNVCALDNSCNIVHDDMNNAKEASMPSDSGSTSRAHLIAPTRERTKTFRDELYNK